MGNSSYFENERKEFLPYLEKVKSFGYRVFVRKYIEFNYAYIVDGHGIMSYIEKDRFGGVNIGTKHKPCRSCGTGFNIGRMVSLKELTPDLVNRSFCLIPQGYSSARYAKYVEKVLLEDKILKEPKFMEAFYEL